MDHRYFEEHERRFPLRLLYGWLVLDGWARSGSWVVEPLQNTLKGREKREDPKSSYADMSVVLAFFGEFS